MGASISLNVKFVKTPCISSIINDLILDKWSIFKDENITYLPIDDNEMFNWSSEKMEYDEFMNLIANKNKEKDIIGVVLYWNKTNIGITLLFNNSDSKNLSIGIDFDRKYIDEESKTVDFNWYFSNIMPAIMKSNSIWMYEFSCVL